MILGIGSINVDYIIRCERLPIPGETVYSKNVEIMLGGKGAVQICAASRLGADTMFLGMVGSNDFNNPILFEDFKRANVNVEYIKRSSLNYSGSAFVFVSDSGQNNIIINTAANASVTTDFLDKNRKCFEKAKVCMTEFGISLDSCEHAMKLAKEHDKITIVNPAPYAHINDQFYSYIDIITPNEIEAAGFCGFVVDSKSKALEASKFFHNKGVENVIITMGEQGAFVSNGKEYMMLDVIDAEVVDTSGAGDSFNGAVAYAISKGLDLFEAAKFGNSVASLSVQKPGTTRSLPTMLEVKENFNFNLD